MTVEGAAPVAIRSGPDALIAARYQAARRVAGPAADGSRKGPRSATGGRRNGIPPVVDRRRNGARALRGHRAMAITSAQDTVRSAPRQPNGQRFPDPTDRVPDNGMLTRVPVSKLPDGGAIPPVTAALLTQLIVAEVVQRLLDAGARTPVYLSANIPGGDEHNRILEQRYAGRIRRTA
ncbi:hypothetical protein Athai_33060 [Actinocatenispora thailandica]|uniref:Uncharacterized protein n=1 Tax=Actinocatenispora thailandica TaxID=227318 RepID=A0A7R7DQ78_9ACTN|nr:hypothetical protein [Actinocatenispora thailandica]BCJ35803.1 hypothetical protein Athai_33060 [Actinocatenispora thailandica]